MVDQPSTGPGGRMFHQGTTTPQAIDLRLAPPNELPPGIAGFINVDCSEML